MEAGEISLASPVGHALVGRVEGEEIEVSTPLGRRHFRVLSVTPLHDRLAERSALLEAPRCA